MSRKWIAKKDTGTCYGSQMLSELLTFLAFELAEVSGLLKQYIPKLNSQDTSSDANKGNKWLFRQMAMKTGDKLTLYLDHASSLQPRNSTIFIVS